MAGLYFAAALLAGIASEREVRSQKYALITISVLFALNGFAETIIALGKVLSR
jgi:hypothetical protein